MVDTLLYIVHCIQIQINFSAKVPPKIGEVGGGISRNEMSERKIPRLIYGRLKRTENFDEHFLLH
jgi:hypothetical protein